MTSYTLLDHSIAKWKYLSEISEITFIEKIQGLYWVQTCSLCRAYIKYQCFDCPVYKFNSLFKNCQNTPVYKIECLMDDIEQEGGTPTKDHFEIFTKLAKEEYEFLKEVKETAEDVPPHRLAFVVEEKLQEADSSFEKWKRAS